MRTRDIKQTINVIKDAERKVEKINKEYPEKYKIELDEIRKDVVSKWYNTYEPYIYNRHMDLKNAAKVSLEGINYRVQFGSEFMEYEHRADNEYIYQNSFIDGYHGGASDGIEHPNPGIPYWRRPVPQFSQWGRPAKRSFSPYYEMRRQMKNKIKELDKQKQDEFDKILERVMRSVNKLKK